MVIKFDEKTKRISLGIKQLDSNPWEAIKEGENGTLLMAVQEIQGGPERMHKGCWRM